MNKTTKAWEEVFKKDGKVFFDPHEDMNMITPLPGYKTPQQLEVYLTFFAADKHKSSNHQATWDAYRDSYQPKFK